MGHSPFFITHNIIGKVWKQLGLNYILCDPPAPAKSRPAIAKPINLWEQVPPKVRLKLQQQYKPAYSLWVYPEYYLDILDPNPSDRKNLILKILKALKWSQSEYSFWPLFILKEQKLVPDLEFFLFGLREIQPIYIFCFGPRCFNCLLPESSFEYGCFSYQQTKLLALPDFDQLLRPENQKLKDLVWKTLLEYSPR